MNNDVNGNLKWYSLAVETGTPDYSFRCFSLKLSPSMVTVWA